MVNGNNHAPEFDAASTAAAVVVAVPHTLRPGVKVASLPARDSDLGDSLIYSISGGNGSSYFAVDPASGDVTLFDRVEVGQVLDLEVKVEDSGTPRLSDLARVRMLVTEDNRHDPVFKDVTSRIYIREDDAIGKDIIYVGPPLSQIFYKEQFFGHHFLAKPGSHNIRDK